MEISDLYRISDNLVRSVNSQWHRYLYSQINWDVPMLCVKGARGVGKTTLMWQHIQEEDNGEESLYVSLDNIWFSENRLFDLADYHYSHGGRRLYVDEVHRYPQGSWAQELKNIYDSFPGLKVVFSGSSLLQIDMSKADLSRRCIFYDLQGLSFREYLEFSQETNLKAYTLDEVLEDHVRIAGSIASQVTPLKHFSDYLRQGYYPFYPIYTTTYGQALQQIINTILENDLMATAKVESVTINKFKRLLYLLSQNVPYTPNIAKICRAIETNRNQTYDMLSTLARAALIINLYSGKENLGQLAKPEKIYLDNTNLAYAMSSTVSDGNVRETFFANQLRQSHIVAFSGDGDFLIDNKYAFEVGGKGKNFDQIRDLPNSYLAIDNVEVGHRNRIPLWLLGFLY